MFSEGLSAYRLGNKRALLQLKDKKDGGAGKERRVGLAVRPMEESWGARNLR
jgi:hypothetical protein